VARTIVSSAMVMKSVTAREIPAAVSMMITSHQA